MISASVKLDRRKLDDIMRESPVKVRNLLDATAFEGEGYAKRSMGSSPSRPGEPPGVRTGNLRASIHVETRSEFERAVVTGVDYAAFLEFGTRHMQARPFMLPMAYYLERMIPELWARFID